MSVQNQPEQASPWRRLFEDVRRITANRRDEHGIIGSINWLRKQMEQRGANPNVVRNIIYRDKGRLADKRVLFDILGELWSESSGEPLRCPAIEVVLSHSGEAEGEVVRLLGREKRRAYRTFVAGVRSGEHPKLLVTGRPGSGKTLLVDYIQEALEMAPRAAGRIVRLEFGPNHLAASLVRLAVGVGVPAEIIESKLVKIGVSGAFAVQADAQAEVARTIIDAVRSNPEPFILLAHVSRPSGGEERLGNTPLRLNTPEVPRVSAAEWLWFTLFDPLSRMPSVALLLSMTDMPARTMASLGAFDEPIRLSPPTVSEARRFVRARLPQFDPREQEALVRRGGRSFEQLRTLTLLAELRAPLPGGGSAAPEASAQHVVQLGSLVKSGGDASLRDFLTSLAVLSLAEYPTFALGALRELRGTEEPPSTLELAFLDPVPPDSGRYRPFSREFARELRRTLLSEDPDRFRAYSRRAAEYYRQKATSAPSSEDASRYLHHLFHGRDWESIVEWISRYPVQGPLIRPLWEAARAELQSGAAFERVALQVATHYVRLGAYEHPDTLSAFAALEASERPELRSWSLIQRAEGAVRRGQIELAEGLLARCPPQLDELREAEATLVRASIARWRSNLDEAASLVDKVDKVARSRTEGDRSVGRADRSVQSKAAIWAGLIAKDRGDLETAMSEFDSIPPGDDLVQARVAFQRGDVLLALGRFDGALTALNEAVRLAQQSQALIPEQTRYLSRRGTLHRKRGDLRAAMADFDSVRAVILGAGECPGGIERDFWLARSEDERALALLADGQFEPAILSLEANMAVFESYGRHLNVDPGFRLLRGTLRLGRAYLFRALGCPYRLPLSRTVDEVPQGPDLRHARSLIASVSRNLTTKCRSRLFWPLRRDALLLSSLASSDPDVAIAQAQCALAEARYPYHLAESRAYLAHARLRAGDASGALADAATARGRLEGLAQCAGMGPGESGASGLESGVERGDVALQAWLAALELQARLHSGEARVAALALKGQLAQRALEEYHDHLLRVFGEALETADLSVDLQTESVIALVGPDAEPLNTRVRLPDALSAWWAARRRVITESTTVQ